MTDDVKALITEAREWVKWNYGISRSENQNVASIIERLADALDAATVALAVDREALAERLFYIDGRDDWGVANEHEREEYLKRAGTVMWLCEARDVRDVQAEALSGAALNIVAGAGLIPPPNGRHPAEAWLHDRAQAIREARSER